jgi:hypothetical protein
MFSRLKIIVVFLLLVWMTAPSIANAEPWRYWKQGEVTRAQWTADGFQKIGIDKIPYTMMPEFRIYQVTQSNTGALNEAPIDLDKVKRTQRVEFLVQGFRIYQLKVLP